jgi:hypothetical protein
MNQENVFAIPAIGCDGVPSTGQAWVRIGSLSATVIIPPSCGKAIALMTSALQSKAHPAEHTFMAPEACPPIETLKPIAPVARKTMTPSTDFRLR